MLHSVIALDQHIQSITQSISLNSLKEFVDLFFISIGVKHYNYVSLGSANNAYKTTFIHNNYNQSWIQKYTTRNYTTIDPTIFKAMTCNNIFSWHDACEYIKKFHINKARKSLFYSMIDAVNNENLHNGIGIPIIMSIHNKNGFYFVLTNNEDTNNFTRNVLHAMCIIINNAFLAFEINPKNDTFKRSSEENFPFTEREIELIKLMYLGKDRIDITELMDISINTVDTMTKRMFLKMHVNSKIQLITKIIAKGWIYMFL